MSDSSGDAARAAGWLAPDEQILWRGRPEHRVRLDSRGVAAGLLSVAFLAYGAVFLVASRDDPLVFRALLGGIVAVWVWQLVVAPTRRRYRSRRMLFAVTTTRAVVVTDGRTVESATLASAVVVRRQRDAHHGSAMFALPTEVGRVTRGEEIFAPELWAVGSTRLRASRGEPAVLAFSDFDHVDGFVTAARHAGFVVTITPEPSLRSLAAAHLGMSTARTGATAARPRGIRGWVATRMLRHPLRVESPLPPAEAIARLTGALTPRTRASTLGFGARGAPGSRFTGSVMNWSVRAAYQGGMQNSWTWTFEGGIYTEEPGSVLLGTVGPQAMIPVIGVAVVGFVSLFALGAIAAGVTQLATGHPPVGLAFALIPLCMLGIFVGITEIGSRLAAGDWARMEERLFEVLGAPST